MTVPLPSPNRPLPLLIFLATAGLLAVAATRTMFSAFMFYDDEGYVLLSLRNFAEHGALYRDVYSQYGPFPYVFYYGLQALGLPLTHTVGRVLTLAAWGGTALACAALVGRATASLPARLAVLAGVSVTLWVMANEPTHPGGLVAVLTALLAYVGHRAIQNHQDRAWAFWAGAGTAVLLLTKINIGGLAALSALAWLLLHHEHGTIRRWAPPVLLLGVATLPFVLMRQLMDAPWVRTYALVFACAGVAAIGAAARGSAPRVGWRALGPGALGAGLIGLPVLAVFFARGSSVGDLLEGMLLRPLRHPVHFNLDFPWPKCTGTVALLSVGLFAAASLLSRTWRHAVDLGVAVLRLLATAVLATIILRFPAISPDQLFLAFGVSCLWLFLWPLADEPASALAARIWLGLLFLGQSLHGFPVRGSQAAWGTFLALPLAALGAGQALTWLADHIPLTEPRRRSGRGLLQAATLGLAFVTTWHFVGVGNRYREGRDLGLPGAEHVRLPEKSTAVFQLLTLNAAAHGDMLFSLPGMFSFNLWSGLPTPTLVNVTHWFSLLEKSQQEAIVRALERHPRACVIVSRDHLNIIIAHGFYTANPLSAYLAENFVPAFSIDGFEFCVRRGRAITPFNLAEVFLRTPPGPGETAPSGDTLLKVNVFIPPGRAVARIEIVTASPAGPLVLSAADTRVELTPINLRGEPTGPSLASAWPFAATGPTLVALYFDRRDRRFSEKDTLIVLRASDGADLALLRVRP